MRSSALCGVAVTLLCLCAVLSQATVFGTLRGIVHDPQHRPLSGAQVNLKATTSNFQQTVSTDDNGTFEFRSIPLGQYTISVSHAGFEDERQSVFLNSGSAPVLHFQLALGTVQQQVEVSASPAEINTESSTTQTTVSRTEVAETPGADRTNSLAMITDFVPGAYMVHDQLHIRGGHQVTWALDGVPLPNTNVASNVGAQFDPKDVDYLEVQRGGYSAEYGDRTYGVFNVAPRTGFERNRQGELVLGYGSYNSTDDQLSFGDHSSRFAYYASLNGNRSDLGLETPTAAVLHDAESGGGGFTSLIFNPKPSDQLRFVGGARVDYYQVPNDPEQQASDIRDREREQDAFGIFSWIHTLSSDALLTISPFYHFNRAAFEGGPLDVPSPTDNRASNYAGGQASVSVIHGRHNFRAGVYGFAQHDNQLFRLAANDGSGAVLQQRETPNGAVEALFAEEQFKATSWLTFNAGFRFTNFSGPLTENATDPRIGTAIRVPRINWVFRGFYGRYYQPPPLLTLSGPLLQLAVAQGFGFLPLKGERDEQHEFGITIPVHGWVFDAANFRTGARNFFDHDVLGNSNIFFPLTIDHVRIRGTEATVRSPKVLKTVDVHLAYSHQSAEGTGGVVGGLTDFSPPEAGFFFLDHDQRNTLSTGFTADLPWRVWFGSNLNYGSGFLNGDGPDHLPSYRTVDVSVGKSFGESWSVKFTGLNVTNKRYQLDLSNTFGGSHFAYPRTVAIQLRYRFHY
jgi:outer membrane receptor protein involved in Fe transport